MPRSVMINEICAALTFASIGELKSKEGSLLCLMM